jgi:hypothetical protein
LGVSWKSAFQVSSFNELKEFCIRVKLNLTVKNNNIIQISHEGKVTQFHRYHKKLLWFNQINLFHPISLESDIRERLDKFMDRSEFPSYVRFANGDDIPDSYVKHIIEVYEKERISFLWEAGDLLILDNMRMAHGRNKYEGERKIVTGMSDLYEK